MKTQIRNIRKSVLFQDFPFNSTIFADNVSLFAEIFASVIQGSGVGPNSIIVYASDLHLPSFILSTLISAMYRIGCYTQHCF